MQADEGVQEKGFVTFSPRHKPEASSQNLRSFPRGQRAHVAEAQRSDSDDGGIRF